ncbi:MAG: hypothetical protein ACOC5T_08920 [Elusimicrobiota bacterium]
MAGNRYPNIEKELYDFYDKTSKSVLMELVRDYALQLNGSENIAETILEIKKRKELICR